MPSKSASGVRSVAPIQLDTVAAGLPGAIECLVPGHSNPIARTNHIQHRSSMLIDTIRSLIGGRTAPAEDDAGAEAPTSAPAVDPLNLAACVLLLEVAHADGEFSDEERAHLEGVLERQFSLPPESGRRLMEEAEKERKASVDHYRFTSRIHGEYDLGQKMVLAEVMWGLVLADGEISEHEQYMTRKISNLLDLKPGYLSAAKRAAAERTA